MNTPTQTCRFCIWWKRLDRLSGVCWHETNHDQIVSEFDSCDQHEPKTIRVPR